MAPTVDVHAHFFPADLPAFADRTGDVRWPMLVPGPDTRIVQGGRTFRVIERSYFDVEARLARLDRLGIDTQVLSPLPVLLPSWAEGSLASDWCRAVNESMGSVVAASDRFLGMGILPLQDPESAVAEVGRLAAAGFVGVELGTAIDDGRFLGDPAADEVLDAIGEAGLRILVHPNRKRVLGSAMSNLESSLGLLTDTAASVGELILRRYASDRCPRMCIAHGGGTLLWAWHRIASRSEQSFELPAWLYVDTAGCTPEHIAFAASAVGPDAILFGSDLPAIKDQRVEELVDRLAVDRPDVLGANALAFIGANLLSGAE